MKKYLIIILLISKFSFSQNILWEEGFDSTDVISEGWTIINKDKSATLPEIFSSFTFVNSAQQNPQEGNYFFKFSFDDANYQNIADDWLITPKLSNIQEGDSISFWCGAIDRRFKDSLKIWISAGDSLLSSFILIDQFKVDGPAGAWHKRSYDLSKYAGKNIFFALNYFMVNGGPLGNSSDNLWVDHFILEGKGFGNNVPVSYMLRQNFPNPFNPKTEIIFSVPDRSNVLIKIYDALGKELRILVNGVYEKGNYNFSFDGSNLPSGVYFYKMVAGDFQDTKKMELIK